MRQLGPAPLAAECFFRYTGTVITVTELSLSYGERILFKDVNLKFTPGNCYGIIGANGAGKSTFLKILSGETEHDKGEISVSKGERMAVLSQDHFAFEAYPALETVIMGYPKLYQIQKDREAIYAKEDFTEEDGMKASELEADFADLGGWEAEAQAGQPFRDWASTRATTGGSCPSWMRAVRCGCFSPRLFSAAPTFCFWTNRPTAWIWNRSPGWRTFLSTFPIR